MTLWTIIVNGHKHRWLDPDDYSQEMIEQFAKQHYGDRATITVKKRPMYHATGRLGSGEEIKRDIIVMAD
jgi:hypothetical protein